MAQRRRLKWMEPDEKNSSRRVARRRFLAFCTCLVSGGLLGRKMIRTWRRLPRARYPVRTTEVVAQNEGENLHLFLSHLGPQGPCYRLNPSGRTVWELADGNHDVLQIADSLAAHLNRDRREVEDAVRDFLAGLTRQGLIWWT